MAAVGGPPELPEIAGTGVAVAVPDPKLSVELSEPPEPPEPALAVRDGGVGVVFGEVEVSAVRGLAYTVITREAVPQLKSV